MTALATSVVLGTRLRAVHARGRMADALLGVALDVLEPYASDYLSADEYSQLCGLVRAPVNAATEAALTTLSSELALVVSEADPGLAARLETIRQLANVAAD